MTAHQLFQPFRLKSLELKNRIVMAPMTRSFSPGGTPTPQVAEYYARRAEGKVGLIVSEGTVGAIGLSGDFLAAFQGEASTPSSLDELLRRFDRGDFDLVAVGRALLADEGWARKINEGRSAELRGFSKEALATLS